MSLANLKRKRSTSRTIIPGFRLTLGISMFYLSIIVFIPLAIIFLKSFELTFEEFWAAVTNARVLASYRVSFVTALCAALINTFFGLIVAWVLVRYQFPGKKIIDALVDIPFALPTAVAGIALTAIYAKNGWIGSFLEPLGIKVAYAPLGIIVALTFIGIPFVVRTVQPVIEDLEKDMEEAAVMLGAYRLRTFFRIILPTLFPALLTGFTLAFARGIGEYGSVVFISGNMPLKTEISPLLIMTKLEQYDYAGATAIAAVMLVVSFILLFAINLLQWRMNRRMTSNS
ncbi:MAG: sulfate ABC transporter permease subunit CysT [Candidatus Pristimantibacillus lignocellulolyticus]|uniref:Sulfate transport system permease protein CysT n=1 Tax=Candidatus Pristimantibacillus lignocellulolyticus TaxID=2994561 RepID=A0A9J6ZF41_9BACL|nr:MAG: sulfate ABC transporter permease subunit CysT [Candidatus Pristimantibacillus lignocellulolyticus]